MELGIGTIPESHSDQFPALARDTYWVSPPSFSELESFRRSITASTAQASGSDLMKPLVVAVEQLSAIAVQRSMGTSFPLQSDSRTEERDQEGVRQLLRISDLNQSG